jgi:hypothetical protein
MGSGCALAWTSVANVSNPAHADDPPICCIRRRILLFVAGMEDRGLVARSGPLRCLCPCALNNAQPHRQEHSSPRQFTGAESGGLAGACTPHTNAASQSLSCCFMSFGKEFPAGRNAIGCTQLSRKTAKPAVATPLYIRPSYGPSSTALHNYPHTYVGAPMLFTTLAIYPVCLNNAVMPLTRGQWKPLSPGFCGTWSLAWTAAPTQAC